MGSRKLVGIAVFAALAAGCASEIDGEDVAPPNEDERAERLDATKTAVETKLETTQVNRQKVLLTYDPPPASTAK